MNAGFKANKQLWYGAAGLFVTALVTKQLIWASLKDFVSNIYHY